MKKMLFIICALLMLSGCAHSVLLQSGEKLSFPSDSKTHRIAALPGMYVVDGRSCFKEIQTSGTVVIVDEYPSYDFAHRFTAYFETPGSKNAAALIFRGDSFPISVVTEEQWTKMKANDRMQAIGADARIQPEP